MAILSKIIHNFTPIVYKFAQFYLAATTNSHILQWGSKCRTSLVFEWSQVVRLLNGSLFEYRTKFSLVFRPPFEYRTSEYQTSESFQYSNVRYSDPHFISLLHILARLLEWVESRFKPREGVNIRTKKWNHDSLVHYVITNCHYLKLSNGR